MENLRALSDLIEHGLMDCSGVDFRSMLPFPVSLRLFQQRRALRHRCAVRQSRRLEGDLRGGLGPDRGARVHMVEAQAVEVEALAQEGCLGGTLHGQGDVIVLAA